MSHHSQINRHSKDPCRGQLTVKEYLTHMIDHHQVAIDISKHMQKYTKWDKLHEMLRKIIWVQSWEITHMKILLYQLPDNVSKMGNNKPWITTGSSYPPNVIGFSDAYCDPMFFDPSAHKKHYTHMNQITDDYYIDHMIPHHQVAVDMSKKILQNTDSDVIVYLANRIIKSQEGEIIYLTALKDSYRFKSCLLHYRVP